MGFTLVGLIVLAFAPSYAVLLAGAALIGVGSSIFHPEASRIARLASGGQHGLAQSVFQVGGNFGQSLGPLLAAFFILPRGQASLAWFALARPRRHEHPGRSRALVQEQRPCARAARAERPPDTPRSRAARWGAPSPSCWR